MVDRLSPWELKDEADGRRRWRRRQPFDPAQQHVGLDFQRARNPIIVSTRGIRRPFSMLPISVRCNRQRVASVS
jgi:hypothetical protein